MLSKPIYHNTLFPGKDKRKCFLVCVCSPLEGESTECRKVRRKYQKKRIKKIYGENSVEGEASVLSRAALNDHTAFFLDFRLLHLPQHPSSDGSCSLSFSFWDPFLFPSNALVFLGLK